MDELKITKRTEPVMFTIRVDKSIVDFYDDLAQKTNRSRNELIGLALEYAKDKIKIEEKLCCPEPDGDEPLHWIVVGSPKKFFLLYKLLLVRKLKQTYKSQIQEGA